MCSSSCRASRTGNAVRQWMLSPAICCLSPSSYHALLALIKTRTALLGKGLYVQEAKHCIMLPVLKLIQKHLTWNMGSNYADTLLDQEKQPFYLASQFIMYKNKWWSAAIQTLYMLLIFSQGKSWGQQNINTLPHRFPWATNYCKRIQWWTGIQLEDFGPSASNRNACSRGLHYADGTSWLVSQLLLWMVSGGGLKSDS